MPTHQVVFEGQPIGYLAREWVASKGNPTPKTEAWTEWAKTPQLVSNHWRDKAVEFMQADKRNFVLVGIWIFYKALSGKRPDPDHVYSSILDALFSEDRNAVCSGMRIDEDAEHPRTIVQVKWEAA